MNLGYEACAHNMYQMCADAGITPRIAGYEVTKHAYARALKRGIEPDAIAATIIAPDERRINADGTEQCISDLCTAVINRATQVLITVYPGRIR